MKRIMIAFVALFFLLPVVPAQEFRCNIQLTHQRVQTTNRQVFETLQNAINEFVNGRAWTNYQFANHERIECSMLFNIQDYKSDQFTGTLQIQVRRPVFNSSYHTVLFNFVDNDIDFQYIEFEPLEFSETAHLSNLTSILAYYVNIIMGLDFDSFGLKSGTEFYQQAERIVTNAQNAKERGWRAGESTSRKNRYWLVANILNEEYAPIREFVYRYHRQGLDRMYEKSTEARLTIAESVRLLHEVHQKRPDPFMYFLQVMLDAKSDEFVSIFQEAMDDEKRRVVALLNQIDPTHADKYRKIMTTSP
jgi:hypothetical protein